MLRKLIDQAAFLPPSNLHRTCRTSTSMARDPTGRDKNPRRNRQTIARTRQRAGRGWERIGATNLGRRSARPSSSRPPTTEEKLRTIFVHRIPADVGDDIERLLRAVGKLRRWDSGELAPHRPQGRIVRVCTVRRPRFTVPCCRAAQRRRGSRQEANPDAHHGELESIEKAKLQVSVDASTEKYLESWEGSREEDRSQSESRLEDARSALQQVLDELFFPKTKDEADVVMGESGGDVEVINIS